MAESLKKTPLFELHKTLGGKMVPFAGYSMPVSYGAIRDEYFAVRDSAGFFDISHMAPVLFSGSGAEAFLEYLTCKKIEGLKQGQVIYNALMNPNGGVVDDITVYRLDSKRLMVIFNAANKEKALKYLEEQRASLNELDVTIEPATDYVLLAIQGPASKSIVETLCKENLKCALPDIYYYECGLLSIEAKGANFSPMISRTGYTGEDGFELLLPQTAGIAAAEYLSEGRCRPCGLASRDLLRMEVFYPLYGHELKEDWTPYEGGIGWLVDLDKDFLCRDILAAKKENTTSRIRGFRLKEQGVPREGFKVFNKNNQEIGFVTSGGFSFLWNAGFGMAFVKIEDAKKGSEIFIDIRGQKKSAEVLIKSPYRGSIVRRPDGA